MTRDISVLQEHEEPQSDPHQTEERGGGGGGGGGEGKDRERSNAPS